MSFTVLSVFWSYGVTLCLANYPAIISAPDRSACRCARTAQCALTLNSSAGRPPAPAASGEGAGRREAAWKAPVIAKGGEYNGRYGKFAQRRALQLYRYGKKEMQLCTHIVRCQVWVQVVNAWKVNLIKYWSEFCVSLNKCNKFFAIKGHQKGHKQAINTHHRPWLRWSRLFPCSPVAMLQPH